MISYYDKPFKKQAHIHTLDGKMGEITILGGNNARTAENLYRGI